MDERAPSIIWLDGEAWMRIVWGGCGRERRRGRASEGGVGVGSARKEKDGDPAVRAAIDRPTSASPWM